MIRLVYVSTAAANLSERDVEDMLRVAMERNAGLGVTGLLVYNGRNFMQALEGAPDAVLDLMTSISRDHRHSGVIVISREQIAERAFPDWSMKLTHSDRADGRPQNLLVTNGIDYSIIATIPPNLASLFTNFNTLQ